MARTFKQYIVLVDGTVIFKGRYSEAHNVYCSVSSAFALFPQFSLSKPILALSID